MRIDKSISIAIAAASFMAACSSPDEPAALDVDALKDPEACRTCHPNQFKDWSSSMHAYAADDPVFVAANARAQRETKGALGSFCVKCHAPVAVADGATTDGLNVASLPKKLKGVTCYFCHSVAEVKGTHDAALGLSGDKALRGGIRDPLKTSAHASSYSTLHDRASLDSSGMCGACHDIVTPAGAAIERTFSEWNGTLFSHPSSQLTCGQCHMEGRDGQAAAVAGAPARKIHAHTFAGVDVALTDFPDVGVQRSAVQAQLDSTLQSALCVHGVGQDGLAQIQVVLDNVGAGHGFTSGAAPDRRAWVELTAYSKGKKIYESGVVPVGNDPTTLADPDMWLVRDCLFDAQQKPTSLFWQAASYDSNTLPGPTTNVMTDPDYYKTHVLRTFPQGKTALMTAPDQVKMRVLLTPIGRDVLDELVASKDLDPAIAAKMPTFELAGGALEWTDATATIKYADKGLPVSCTTVGLTTGANTAFPAPEHTRCAK